jgi:16S rRNA (adenine1518-N6/adenine1519-N6)-dimethyltransferase
MMSSCGTRALRALKQSSDPLIISTTAAPQSSETESSPCPSPTKLIANLPYAVAATIVLDYFEHIPSLQSATIMVQKEVADRMAAQPGTKDYGAYTVKLALFAQPTASFGVARTNFLPPPRVDSTVIRLDRHSSQPTAELAKATYTVIEAAFAQRRKTIRNSMRSHFSAQQRDPEQIDALLEAVNIAPTLRGETLSVADYLRLGEAFATQP